MFRAPLCPSPGAKEYYTVVAACSISCCGFSSCWSGVELRVVCPVCRMLQHPANRLGDPGVDGGIILRWIFREWDVGGMDWIELAQDRNRWRALVNVVMNLRVS